jgi:Fe-S-cluster containining protein
MSDLDAMPSHLRDQLLDYRENLRNNPHILSREVQNLPCIWWLESERVCVYYEHRPPICRDFKIGGGECVAFREWKLAVLTGAPRPVLPIPPHPGGAP